VWIKNGALEIHLSGADGDPYSVTDRDLQHARKIEELLPPMQDRLIDPPIESELCICPKFHRDYWRT
jgi:hypothetical protein